MRKAFLSVVFCVFCLNVFGEITTRLSSNVYIDWTKGLLVVEYSSKTDFIVGKRYFIDILDLKNSVKREVMHEVFSAISGLPFDSSRLVRDVFEIFPEKRARLVSLLDKVDLRDFRYFSGKVMAKYMLEIYGDNGIFNILRLPSIPRNYNEFLNLSEHREYTGLLISVKNVKFNISLSVRILSESGRVVYSYADYRGKGRYIHFFRSLKSAIDSSIFGDNILYVVPVRVEGDNLSDIVLDDGTIEKILSLQENHDIFFSGKVGIIFED